MFIRRALIRNVRSIEELEWRLPEEKPGGWHVVLGDNGSGKSTFLRCLALGLIGVDAEFGIRQDWSTWRRTGTIAGFAELDIVDFEPAIYQIYIGSVNSPGLIRENVRRNGEASQLPMVLFEDSLEATVKLRDSCSRQNSVPMLLCLVRASR